MASSPITDDSPQYRTGLYPWYVVGVLLLVNALSYLDRQVMSILISPIQGELGFSDTQMGWVIGPAFMALFLLAGLPMGWLADRRNRSILLASGILIWSIGTIATALADSFGMMAASRAVVGLGEACVVPAAYSLVADYFAPHKRGKAIAWVTIGIPIGAGSALFLGGFLLRMFDGWPDRTLPLVGEQASWSLVLLAFGVIGIVVSVLALTIVEPRKARPLPVTASVDASGGFIGFLRREPVGVAVVLIPYILLTFMQIAQIVWVPTLLTRRQGLEPADAGILFGILTLIIPITATLTGGWVADKLMRRFAAGPFMLVTWLAPAFLPGVLLFALPQSLPLVIVGLVITLAVGGVCSTTVYAAVQTIAPTQFRGRILALYGLLAQFTGLFFAPPLVGAISDYLSPDKSMLHVAIVIAVVPAWVITVVCGFVGRRHYADLRAKAEALAA